MFTTHTMLGSCLRCPAAPNGKYIEKETTLLPSLYCSSYSLTSLILFQCMYMFRKSNKFMVQLNLNLTEHLCGMALFSFLTYASIHIHARLMTSNLPFRALVYTSDVCTTVCRCKRACQECIHQIWIVCILVCMQTVSGINSKKCSCTKV